MEKYIDLGKASQKTLGLQVGKLTDPDPLLPNGVWKQAI